MIRIVFDTGELIDCEHIDKIYVEKTEMEKLTVVGCIPQKDSLDCALQDVSDDNLVIDQEDGYDY